MKLPRATPGIAVAIILTVILSFTFLTKDCLNAAPNFAIVNYRTNDLSFSPTNILSSNILEAAGISIHKGENGRLVISNSLPATGGTNSLIFTNGSLVGSIGSLNWTTGVTGYVASGVVNLGVSVTGGGGSLQTNANQFGASVVLTIKDGALMTNLVLYGLTNNGTFSNSGPVFIGGFLDAKGPNTNRIQLNLPHLTASRSAIINAEGDLTNSSAASNWSLYDTNIWNDRQGGNSVLTNLVGTVARNVTNVISLSTTNATSKPLTSSYTAGVLTLFGLEAGANVSLSQNGSNIVITGSAGGSGFAALEVMTNTVRVGLQTNINFVTNANMAVFATNNAAANRVDVQFNVQGNLADWALYPTNVWNTRQGGSAVLSNLTGLADNTYTNVPKGGTNISVRTVGGTNFIDTTGELNNWALYSTNVWNPRQGGNAVLSNLVGTVANNVTNFVSLSTTNATSKPLTNSYTAGVLTMFGIEQGSGQALTMSSNIVIANDWLQTASTTNVVGVSNWVNSVSNLVATKQQGNAVLTNLVGTVGRNVTNVVSLSTTNATSKPLTNSYTSGVLTIFGIEQGSGTVLTMSSNIVVGLDWLQAASTTNVIGVSNWVNSVSNLVATKQHGSAVLTNLVGTVANNVTNVVSLSTTNATSKPLTNSYTAGVLTLFGLEAGANVSLTPNASNIVIASTGGGGGLTTNANQFLGVPLSIIKGSLLTNTVIYESNYNYGPMYLGLPGGSGIQIYSYDNIGAQYRLFLSSGTTSYTLGTNESQWILRGVQFTPDLDNVTDFGFSTKRWHLGYFGDILNVSNLLSAGYLTITNIPGTQLGFIELRSTNGNSYTKFSRVNDNWKPTNYFKLSVTNPTAGQVLKISSVAYSAGEASIILTNDTDLTGAGAVTTNFDSIRITNQILYVDQDFNGSNGVSAVALTNNWDMTLATFKQITNRVGTNLTFNLSNVTQGASIISTFRGLGAGAYSNTVTLLCPGNTGTNITWMNWATNGNYDFQVKPAYTYTLQLYADTQTNVNAWLSTDDPFVPVAPIYLQGINVGLSNVVATNLAVRAGSSTSNAFVGGTIWFSTTPVANPTSNGTVATAVTIPIRAHTMTNNGDEVRFFLSGTMPTAAVNTNQFQVVLNNGGPDVSILDTGLQIGSNTSYRIKGTITRTGNSAHVVYSEFDWGPSGGVPFVSTNRNFATTTTTNGLDLSIILKTTARRQGAHTNMMARAWFDPAPK